MMIKALCPKPLMNRSYSQNKLIPKNDKKEKNINDLRPISLTNLEYRIFTKILANRLNKLGPKLFSDCQTCSIKGWRINDSINTQRYN